MLNMFAVLKVNNASVNTQTYLEFQTIRIHNTQGIVVVQVSNDTLPFWLYLNTIKSISMK